MALETFVVFVGMSMLLFVVCIFIVIVNTVKSKSKRYREYLTNLYVAGRIRQEAEKDEVDLVKEDQNFIKYDSLSNRHRIKDLDEKIEVELMKKIEPKEEEKKKGVK